MRTQREIEKRLAKVLALVYFHAHCYRDLCLAAGLPDPCPPVRVAKKRMAKQLVRCAVCTEHVMRAHFVEHVRRHTEEAV